ncbi:glycosyl transferase, family 25 [Rhizobium tibeticum]|uniref:Glycosyl transferase, family 25 n=1 Tax=Rhizobium tibeticum TaxID=501024 RepID=A0A1H8HJV9_9HYPH|nr:glycosyltransferase family 25 protein [Rhizobium tibeticum]SEH66698.1 Glycosyltransferase family 25 (LPS biosynthesis protein) [Rhizobium tibeticum]SEN56433.1 glycosyl transferase, family 25 [Rhizobium tibeticum]
MNILIISRRSEHERRHFQSQQMARLGLEYRFLDAFEASDLSPEDCQGAANTWPSPTLRQDIACFTSHRMAWNAVVERNEKTIILEDDAVLSSDIGDVITTIRDRDDDWNCVYDLEFVPQPHIVAKSPLWIDDRTGHKATRVFQNRLGLAGYVIGPRAATRMLEDTRKYALVDAHFWHRSWVAALQIEPAPVVQLRFIGDSTVRAAPFLRTSEDDAFRPQSKLRKHFMRLRLELVKARNLMRAAHFRSEKRQIRMDRAKFTLAPDHHKV